MEPPAQNAYTVTPRKRRRPALSCVQCRQRKVRCDRGLPCGPCVRARSSLASSCFYDSPNRPGRRASIENVSQPHRTRTRQSMSVSSNDAESEKAGTAPQSHSQRRRSMEDLQQRIVQLEELVLRGIPTQRNPALVSGRIEGQRPTNAAGPWSSSQPLKAPPPQLRISAQKTKIFGANSWIQTAEQFQVLGKFISEDVPFTDHFFFTDKAELGNVLKECIQYRFMTRKQRVVETPLPPSDLSSTFPPRATCDELVQAYMRTFEPVYRIFHATTFWVEYGTFWEEPQQVSQHFVVKLALVLAIGSVFRSNQRNSPQREAKIRNWIYSAHWWLIGPSDSASFSIDGIQIACLLILSRLTGPLSTPIWISTGSLLQMSMIMGLHRDTSLFPLLTPFQVEMRNRLWATIIELSTQYLLDAGVPFPLSLDEFDSRGPTNINDIDISPESKEQIQPKNDEVFTDSSIQILLRKSVTTRLEIARLLNDPLRKKLTFERAMQLGQEVRDACREVSAFFQYHTPASKGLDASTMEFHRKFLDMYLQRYLFFLHRPFMIEARKDPRYFVSRKICVESCMVLASHCDRLDLATENADDISRLICVGSGTFKGALCMDVITVLGLELVTQVEEENTLQQPSSVAATAAVDPLSELARANRAPLVRCLERIRDQLEQIVIAGRPSLKRYAFLEGVLALVRAIDLELPIKQTICEGVIVCLKKCRSYLQQNSLDTEQPEASSETLPNDTAAAAASAASGDMPDPFLSFSVNGLDPCFDIDLSDFLTLPNIFATSDMGW